MTTAGHDNCQILANFESLPDTEKRIYATTVCRCDPSGHRAWITHAHGHRRGDSGWGDQRLRRACRSKDLHIKGQLVSPAEYCNENLYDG
ncbi:MAG: hypothetical protein CMJ70_25035 [Planctomycetaceae bacterium]|nr:hypothetical protein [Planctomycetaceae bacterium]